VLIGCFLTCRYIVTVIVADHTGQTWVQMFNEQAEQLIGKNANELEAIQVC
jgi:replication factor A1